MKRLLMAASQLAFLVAFVALWQWASVGQHIDPFFFGQPSRIWDQIEEWGRNGTLTSNLGSTTELLLIGFAAGLLAGTAVGTAMSFSRLVHDVLDPFVVFFNAVPRIVLYPFLLVWLGFGLTTKVVLIVVVMMPTVAISVVTGFKEVDGAYLSNMRALGAGGLDLALHVYVPSLALWLLSTCRITFAFAFQAALVAELVGATHGVGFLIVQGQDQFNVDQIYAALVLVAVIAIVADVILRILERRASRWVPARLDDCTFSPSRVISLC
jgi:NitT/TauT family transport system permease protein